MRWEDPKIRQTSEKVKPFIRGDGVPRGRPVYCWAKLEYILDRLPVCPRPTQLQTHTCTLRDNSESLIYLWSMFFNVRGSQSAWRKPSQSGLAKNKFKWKSQHNRARVNLGNIKELFQSWHFLTMISILKWTFGIDWIPIVCTIIPISSIKIIQSDLLHSFFFLIWFYFFFTITVCLWWTLLNNLF